MADDNQNLGKENPDKNQPSSDLNENISGSDSKDSGFIQPSGGYFQKNSQVDNASNGKSQLVPGFKLGPTEISPNLAKEDNFISEQSREVENPLPDAAAETPAPEMQYPSYNETHESSMSSKFIAIIIAVILLLGGAVGGAFYFIEKTRTEEKAEEEIKLAEEKAREEKIKE